MNKKGVKNNSYLEMKRKQQKAFNEFSDMNMFYAFSNEQFIKGMKSLGLGPDQTDKIIAVGAGGYILKSHKDDLINLNKRFLTEMRESIANDKTGMGFIYDMFLYELRNHEYQLTEDEGDALDALGLTWDDINTNPALKSGLEKASCRILRN